MVEWRVVLVRSVWCDGRECMVARSKDGDYGRMACMGQRNAVGEENMPAGYT